MTVRAAASVEMPKSLAMEGIHPLGALDAKVAFMTSMTALMVTAMRRGVDQFWGFSISSGLKARKPASSRNGGSVWSRSLVR